MLKKILFISTLSIFAFHISWGQNFQSVAFLKYYSPAELAQLALFSTTFDAGANAYKVTYKTTSLEGDSVTVSGLLALPEDLTKRYPMACYQHGTSGTKENVPSRLELDAGIAVSMAAKGFVTVSPDLLGLGDHLDIHPYVHAASEAWVAVDMMRALRNYAHANDIYLNDQVFISGYSQGGHSAMALHRHLEQNLSNEFKVTAAAPMSGPYSIREVMYDLIVSEEVYTRPAYLINTFISYQRVYGNIYTDIAAAFKVPYRQLVEDFSNNLISLGELDIALSDSLTAIEGAIIPVKVLNDSYIDAIISNPDHPMLLAMEDNNVYDWAPQAPTRLYYCEADEEVPFENSILAETTMKDNGAIDVQAINLNPFLTHFICALPAAVTSVNFFETYQLVEDVALSTGEADLYGLEIFPNPSNGHLTLRNQPNNGELSIIDLNGREQYRFSVLQGDNQLSIIGLTKGIYTLRVISGEIVRSQKLVIR